jgi:hypothetical protein
MASEDIGCGPHVKCAASIDTDYVQFDVARGELMPFRWPCVRSPGDGHTVHADAGEIHVWEGP